MSESYRVQYWQFINLIALLILAKVTDRLYLGIFDIFILVIFATFLEILFLYFFKKRVFFPISALISAIGVVLMLGAYSFYIYFWAIFFAISQKYLLKINNNHIFNPSNFGVIVSIALFYPKASILVGQIYGYRVVIFFITIIALTILIKVNRWLVSFSFFIFYIIFQYLIISFSDPIWSIDDIINHFME
ncbi:MAG: hypothetical protein GXO02_02765, partial [Epsilonproteobacteria bacterium]|nr:hypothetical protein [Campylobacterota bacterium]